ncbi:ABC transporter permease [Actinotignum sanguinis]|uniref:ABC transporter permease n=1 Tax=Actinotignum sanguinis TaxID=1445614 RepID=UPI002A811B88|nr:ABC transporter permease [Actinotignum sanguinis]MDY5135981.1 ABC transporter permease [Actinotignum sanguinis]
MFDAALIDSIVRALIPILFAALGGLICDKAGIFNIALEGQLLIGCFFAVATSYYTGSAFLGALGGMFAAGVFTLILAYGSVNRGAEPIVIGVAMNILATGVTSFLLVGLFHTSGTFVDPRIVGLKTYSIPLLSDIPWIGNALFSQTVLGYLTFVLVFVAWIVIFRTPLGLRLRGVGEKPLAAQTLGVNPVSYKYAAVIISGLLCGLGGAQLALGNVVQFSEEMSAGRGWIAVVAVMLARSHPIGVLGAAALFGTAEALGFRAQGIGIPTQVTDAAPYVVTLLALLLTTVNFVKKKKEETKRESIDT